MRWHYRSQSQAYGAARQWPPSTEKVIEMTATQQHGNPVTRFAKTVIRSVRNLNGELTGAGEAMACSNRFPQPSPEQAKQPYPAGKVLVEV